jgi:hypothetical protein
MSSSTLCCAGATHYAEASCSTDIQLLTASLTGLAADDARSASWNRSYFSSAAHRPSSTATCSPAEDTP